MRKKYPEELEDFVRERIPIRNRFTRQELIDEVNRTFSLDFTSARFRGYCYNRGIKVTNGRVKLQPGDYVIKTSGLIYIMQADRSLKNKAQIIYEAVYGPIKKNERLIFLDGDRSNFTLDNFFIVTQKELGHLCRSRMLTGDPAQTLLNINYYRLRVKLKEQAKKLGLLNSRGDFKCEQKERWENYPREKKIEIQRKYRERMRKENPEKYKAWVKKCNSYKKKGVNEIEN